MVNIGISLSYPSAVNPQIVVVSWNPLTSTLRHKEKAQSAQMNKRNVTGNNTIIIHFMNSEILNIIKIITTMIIST